MLVSRNYFERLYAKGFFLLFSSSFPMSNKMNTTNDEIDFEAQRDGFFFKRQGEKTRRRKAPLGAAPLQ